MSSHELHIVTGAFGFSGSYIAQRLLDAGHEVRTLTNSLHRSHRLSGGVKAFPFNFDKPAKLIESLRGASVLYSNYWVRFNYGKDFSYAKALENSLALFDAAKKAGVRRIVHISISNPAEDSPFEYFRGKARLEKAIRQSGLSYAILRPAVLFGLEDILINNIAWFLRRFPVFGVFGDGNYRLQPIYVDDLARLAVEQGKGIENSVIEAIGPETFTYRELAKTVGKIIGKKRPVLSLPPALGYMMGTVTGWLLRDVTITRDEIEGLMAGLLYTDASPTGATKLTDWVRQHASAVGRHYHSELARRKDRRTEYGRL
ncbi:MAG: epimerase [Nitrospirae bacterium GWC2_57_13]|nr:MAG: epimerase [Nitrospirae bacterium GWC1_57_7]OGW27241.1 MAG: epimerase [Nitrospirae bacterium GWC2_57_13]OGW44562.1 MAG: epimerase [Nitrospirae bacterium GWD2_57_8]HAR46170.1 epimerase [Nitrospiraceae bacterium]HAS55034.1 epimerase [Nitrospiraceae bacterium]